MAISLASIATTGAPRPPKVVLYGTEGIGKSTFGASAPDPIFIRTEDGLGSIETNAFPLATSYIEVREQIEALKSEDHEFSTLVIDSLDWLEVRLWQYICDRDGQKDIEAYGYGRGYKVALNEWRDLLEDLTLLRDKGMAIVLISHSKIKTFAAPDTDPYDRYQLKLHDSAGALVKEWADTVLFATQKVYTRTTEAAGPTKGKARGTSTGERVMYTEERPAWQAKNRYGLPLELPLAWNAFADSIVKK